jgi:hypothetical protein
MQTLFLDEYFALGGFVTIYDRQLLVTCISDLFERVVILYIRNEIVVRDRTGDLAGSAADAPGCIDEYSNEFFGFLCAVGLYIAVRYAPGGNGS